MKKLLLFSFIIAATTTFSQQINTQKLDSFFNILNENKKAMGSVAISKNGKLLYTNAIGFIDSTKLISANSETKYRIGSITKMFTAVIIFQLIEENKLSLETKLNKYFKEIPNANKITIAQMLHHSSGIYNYTNDSDFVKLSNQNFTQKQLVDFIQKHPPQFEPDSSYEYSNSNFTLLTYILEKITKKTFEQNIKERICAKINLQHTYYNGEIDNKNNEAFSFRYVNNWEIYPTNTNTSLLSGAGGIKATANDLNIFIKALFNSQLVSKEHLEMMQNIKDGYGMAMIRLPFGKKYFYGHTGGIDGFNSCVGYNKEDSLSISVCCNAMNYDFNNILIAILSCTYNTAYKLPTFNKESNLNIDLIKLIGTYSNPVFPLKITISTDGKTLTAQATGQSSFPLEYKENNTFSFDAAGIELTFDSSKNEMTLQQAGRKFVLQKEK